ncbi:MAG: FAD-binding protein [Candidatus Protochlamydia sp.]|nr:FAD-binding protein [Candidatus Protochlamydia sp.]
MSIKHYKFVILGGGLAGLAAAIGLAEKGAEPIVLEGGEYPCHKVCGEFLSPHSLRLLEKWDIHPVPIYRTHLHTPTKKLTMNFQTPAGSLSHYELDPALANYARSKGAAILTSAKVNHLIPAGNNSNFHEIILSTGEHLRAEHLIAAIGRLPQFNLTAPSSRYIGIKSHFSGINLDNALEMFSFPGAYLGLSPIENGKCNLACLAKKELVQSYPTVEAFMQALSRSNSHLGNHLFNAENLFPEWMQAWVPEFGIKKTPLWPNAYFIGDAAGTIPPACGNGLSMALTGGTLAAHYALKGDYQGFRNYWKNQHRRKIFVGKLLNEIMLHPCYGNAFINLQYFFPKLGTFFFNLTR